MSIQKFFEEIKQKTILAQYWKAEIETGIIQTIHFKNWKGGQILILDDDEKIIDVMDKIDYINIDEKEIIISYSNFGRSYELFLKDLEELPIMESKIYNGSGELITTL